MKNPCLQSLLMWSTRRWTVAAAAAVAMFLFVAFATALIANPIFGRAIEPTSWAIPVTILTSLLSGLLFATYVQNPNASESKSEFRSYTAGSVLTFFAVGCPVCNKLVLITLGTSGAIQWFAPIQPLLALAAVLLLLWALQKRLTNDVYCQISTTMKGTSDGNN